MARQAPGFAGKWGMVYLSQSQGSSFLANPGLRDGTPLEFGDGLRHNQGPEYCSRKNWLESVMGKDSRY